MVRCVVYKFVIHVIALLGMTWLGAAGLIDEVDVIEHGLVAQTPFRGGLAFGNVAFVGSQPHLQDQPHEIGHLIHEDELGVLYLPLAIIGSLEGMRRYRQSGEVDDYLSTWTERMADEYGGVER
jgi:hypothetical protein